MNTYSDEEDRLPESKMNKIIEIAQAEIGYTETPNNMTKFGEWFGLNGVAWCGLFVSWVYAVAGYALGNVGYSKGFAGCQTAYNHFKVSGEIVTKEQVQPGDIVLFDWGHDGECDHTGIFVKDVGNGTFETIEGNTSFANQSNGGEVMTRNRSYGSVKAFVHPKVLDAVNQNA